MYLLLYANWYCAGSSGLQSYSTYRKRSGRKEEEEEFLYDDEDGKAFLVWVMLPSSIHVD